MYTQVFSDLGLAKNEAKIYEALLGEGESTVGVISRKSNIHRRNVYDSLNRLIEKGLVFEIIERMENHYQAVDPRKLSEILEEKQCALTQVMPDLESLFRSKPKKEQVFLYRGIEGWKNYFRDIIRVGEDLHAIGGKWAWLDTRLKSYTDGFIKEAKAKGIKFHILYDWEVKKSKQEATNLIPGEHRFLPASYSTEIIMDIFGDHVVLLPNISLGKFDESKPLTVIVNQQIADAFRTWWKFMWNQSTK